MKLIPGLLTCMTAVVIASHQNACCGMAQCKPTHYAFGNFIARTAWQAYASVKVKNNSNEIISTCTEMAMEIDKEWKV